METGSSFEFKTLINELTQGKEQAQQLKFHLNSLPSSESQYLLQQIMSSYEKALLILKPSASPRSENSNKSRNVAKKRKSSTQWIEHVRVEADNGLEGTGNDGFSWRKYGQKDILGAKNPRSYYRCTYRQTQNCWATKQVQRSDEDPSLFEITYKGTHICNLASNLNSPEKQQTKRCYHGDNHHHHQHHQPNQVLMNLKANLRVDINHIEDEHKHKDIDKVLPFSFPPTFTSGTDENYEYPLAILDDDGFGAYTPSFLSPVTPESIYCPVDMFSSNTSSTNSPTMGMEFSLDHVNLDLDFPFHNPGFFTRSLSNVFI